MGQTTKIEWADSTWNPVTGCLHGCEYCYARRIAERFGWCDNFSTFGAYRSTTWSRINPEAQDCDALYEVYEERPPVNVRYNEDKKSYKTPVAPYPFYFQPTLRRDRLNQYERKEGRTIFVCSMADLFGDWVPDEWIKEVFAACRRAPQHRYLFLTKNPKRYINLAERGKLPYDNNMWYGTTVTKMNDTFFYGDNYNTFLSVEPIQGRMPGFGFMEPPNWVIVGAETGNRKGKVIPGREWIEDIAFSCKRENIPLFMKDSLIPIVGEDGMVREFPWNEGGVTNG